MSVAGEINRIKTFGRTYRALADEVDRADRKVNGDTGWLFGGTDHFGSSPP